MRKTTTSPAFVGSPTSVASWTPLGKAGFSFHASASGVTRVGVFCAVAGSESTAKLVIAKSFLNSSLRNVEQGTY
jgi:hypothetical protein